MTLLSLLYLGTLFRAFMWIFDYTLIDMFQLIILFLFSFAVFIFISDNFKFSNNKFIFLLQKFVSYSLNFALIVLVGFMLYLVGVNLSILGSIFFDSEVEAEIEESKLAKISQDEPDSPTKFNRDFIHSVLEENEIPLIVMVNGLSYLNYIEFSLVLSLFSLLFRKFLIRKLTDIIIKFIQKIKQTNKQKFKEVESIKDKDIDKNVTLNQAINTLDKYTDFIIVFIFICLF